MDNPYEPPTASSKPESAPPQQRPDRSIAVESFFVVAIITGMISFLLPAVRGSRGVNRNHGPDDFVGNLPTTFFGVFILAVCCGAVVAIIVWGCSRLWGTRPN